MRREAENAEDTPAVGTWFMVAGGRGAGGSTFWRVVAVGARVLGRAHFFCDGVYLLPYFTVVLALAGSLVIWENISAFGPEHTIGRNGRSIQQINRRAATRRIHH